MAAVRQQRAWLLVATIAIVAALCLLLIPPAHAGHAAAWLAVLPVLFIGLMVPLSASRRIEDLSSGRAPEFPFQRASFQRPPPVQIG
jgi:O-antigen/teichoic acid export membrane protein